MFRFLLFAAVALIGLAIEAPQAEAARVVIRGRAVAVRRGGRAVVVGGRRAVVVRRRGAVIVAPRAVRVRFR